MMRTRHLRHLLIPIWLHWIKECTSGHGARSRSGNCPTRRVWRGKTIRTGIFHNSWVGSQDTVCRLSSKAIAIPRSNALWLHLFDREGRAADPTRILAGRKYGERRVGQGLITQNKPTSNFATPLLRMSLATVYPNTRAKKVLSKSTPISV